ncbi:Phosphatidylglycerol/phosphatidylinositol transfer protein [Lobaria immixta]|nr:Phosphatidylglycerol/phosphatidylinositol transfer protein [Lobaria immixta]
MLSLFSSFTLALSWISATQGTFRMRQHRYAGTTSFRSPHGEIPGGSPLKFCNESRSTDLYSIDQIELYPNPLYIDDVFEVHFYGNFLKNITEKATWTFLARYGNSTEHETGTMDFCESLDSIDQPGRHGQPDCPPEKGFALLKMSAWVMPMFIVPGDYYFKFDAMTKENERIYCLDAEIYLDHRGRRISGR